MFPLVRRGGSLAKVFVCLAVLFGVAITMRPQEAAAQSNRFPTVSVTSPADGATYPAGATVPFSATASDRDGIARIELYVDSVLYATSYSNSATVSLTNVAPGSYTLTATAWDGKGLSATSPGTTLIVSSSGGGANQPPSVSVTSPATGATYAAGATITFSVAASDPDGTITWVGFYVDSVLRSSTTSSPYSTSLSNLAPGVHKLVAVVWDNANTWTWSTESTVTIGSSGTPSNQPPVVTLTAPVAGATFIAPASITVSADASDVDGTIAQVDFYANGTLIRTDTSSPYSISWTNVPAANYALIAVARDNAGATTASSTRDISVRPANLPSTAVFVPSSNHATAVDRYVLEVFPVGANPTVSNPVATRDLGKPAILNGECRADVSSTILALSPGTYIATVTAIGSGGSTQSAPSPQFTR